ncbi:MAG: sensor histidine kinase [Bryobacteraceae bacterium]
MANPPASNLSARSTTIWIGFMGLLILMAAIAIDSGRMLRNVAQTSAALRLDTRERDALLDRLRSDIYHSGTVARDYLLEQDSARAETHKAELERLHASLIATLHAYQQKAPETERTAFQDLRDDVDSYWNSLAPILLWNATARRELGEGFLRDVVIPRRTELVQLARRATALNELDLDAGETRLQAVQAHFRQRVTVISVIALLIGGLLAGITITRLQRLEREAEARYKEVEEARSELRNLSHRLVTAQEEERRNLARELHDEIGQSMSAMLFELGRLEAAAPESEIRRERLASVRRMAEESVGMVRNMALLLRPSMLDDLGLVPALKWQAREVTRRTGLKVKMMAGEISDDLLDSHRTCVYRVVQEALNNCAKHSQATEIRVIVRQDHDGLSVSVQDDGVGFNPRQEKGMGLLGIEERVERLGGLLCIESQHRQGTVLSIHLPLTDARSLA